MIRVHNLSRAYGAVKAVDDVSFAIGDGEVVGLLGHNGAGKTTIMKMLTGYLEPTAGRIEVNELEQSANLRAIQAMIGYLPENCPLYGEMSVVGYLEYQATLHGVRSERLGPLLRETLARTALLDKAHQTISTLSRGYRQRVGVAQAILHRPRIIILDEPTNGLDPTQIQHMRSLIRDLAREATLIISTHILQEVQAVCDRVLIIQRGRLALDAGLDEIRAGRRLLVRLEPQRQAQAMLATIDGVHGIEALPEDNGVSCFALTASRPVRDLAPVVAREITARGWLLYGLESESRSLEKIFSELSLSEGREQ